MSHVTFDMNRRGGLTVNRESLHASNGYRRQVDALKQLRSPDMREEVVKAVDVALVYVPGLWRCAKCEFQLIQSNLNASTGDVTARDQPGDRCPNCDSPLWRVTYKDAYAEVLRRFEEHLDRARTEAVAPADVARDARVTKAQKIVRDIWETWYPGNEWVPATNVDDLLCQIGNSLLGLPEFERVVDSRLHAQNAMAAQRGGES